MHRIKLKRSRTCNEHNSAREVYINDADDCLIIISSCVTLGGEKRQK